MKSTSKNVIPEFEKLNATHRMNYFLRLINVKIRNQFRLLPDIYFILKSL